MKKLALLKRIICFTLIIAFFSYLPSQQNLTAIAASVNDETSKITLNLKSKDLVKKESFSLNVYRTSKGQSVSFKSSNKNIVSVEKTAAKSALITGNKAGTATITVKVKKSFKTITTLTCKITVTPPAISVKLPFPVINLEPAEKYLIGDDVIIKPNITAEIPTYKSSDPDVASISANGILTAHSEGETTIKVQIENGKSDTCKVIVAGKNENDKDEKNKNDNDKDDKEEKDKNKNDKDKNDKDKI